VTTVRIHDAGDSALVADLDAVIDPVVNARAIGIAAYLRAQRIPGVRDVVSTFHSVAVHFDPATADRATVEAALHAADVHSASAETGRTIEIPVTYGGEAGPDLEDVAAFARCSAAEVIDRHTARAYRVYMLGFLPGYPYMAAVDDRISMPRRATPRVRVPAGSVGIAGRQTGIYPRESPGGWQIIGRTPLTLFDPEATSPALCAPGDEVRFVAVSPKDGVVSDSGRSKVASGSSRTQVPLKADTTYERCVTVLQPGLLTTIQDEGRWGSQHLGVPVAGPMDLASHRLANAVLGNPPDAATLEATLIGPELRFEHDAWVAVTGADLQPSVDGRDAPLGVAVKCRADSVLRFNGRRFGARAYIAVEGGIAVPPVLGSRATHLFAALGGLDGRALRAGDRLPLGSTINVGSPRQHDLSAAASAEAEGVAPYASHAGGARLRILPGPQIEHFEASAFEALQRDRYTISPQSDRMGYRLTGARVVAPPGEMISSAMCIGGLQVPPSGAPILLMADRQTTGGYPQLAVVMTADLPRAAQLAPGDWVEFRACSLAEAVAARRAQEGKCGTR